MSVGEGRVGEELAEAIERAKAVSFDFFDTLFVRMVNDPRDVFDLVGVRLGVAGFREIREKAQSEAFRRMVKASRKEITLDDIYACMPGLLAAHVRVDDAREAELQLELALTVPNPRLLECFRDVLRCKPVMVISDMYLPQRFFEAALEKHGLPAVPIFVSAECNATKRDSGELFDIAAHGLGLPAADILHVGDNPVSDVVRARERGFMALHYLNPFEPEVGASVLPMGTSIARSIAKLCPVVPDASTFYGIGFRHGGPAVVGFLEWIGEQARKDGIDFLLFISRDGYVLERMAHRKAVEGLPKHAYFPGSRVAFGLAATDATNFDQQVGFMLAGSHGLAPVEVLERIGVAAPSNELMREIGLGDEVSIDDATLPRMREFLSAYRAEILKCCRRNRRGLFNLLCGLGIRPGMRLAMVDVGWNGTTQETLQNALAKLFNVSLTGYYLCLIDSPVCRARRGVMDMRAMFDGSSLDSKRLRQLYNHRVSIELLFSAPHHAVIGYETGSNGTVAPVEDPGRGSGEGATKAVLEIQRGMSDFEALYHKACVDIGHKPNAMEVALQVFELIDSYERVGNPALDGIGNFDAWGSSRKLNLTARSYMPSTRHGP